MGLLGCWRPGVYPSASEGTMSGRLRCVISPGMMRVQLVAVVTYLPAYSEHDALRTRK